MSWTIIFIIVSYGFIPYLFVISHLRLIVLKLNAKAASRSGWLSGRRSQSKQLNSRRAAPPNKLRASLFVRVCTPTTVLHIIDQSLWFVVSPILDISQFACVLTYNLLVFPCPPWVSSDILKNVCVACQVPSSLAGLCPSMVLCTSTYGSSIHPSFTADDLCHVFSPYSSRQCSQWH